MEPGRRSFLRKAGAYGVGTAASVLALARSSPAPAPEEGILELDDPEELLEDLRRYDALDEEHVPYAIWQYKPTRSGYEATSPVNVVFEFQGSGRTLDDVMAVLDDAGWYRAPEEYTRYAWHYERDEYVVQQASAAETPFGTVGRHHVRCWEIDGTVSMQAHQDTPGFPHHGINSYERTRDLLERLYAADGWSVASAALDFGNEKAPDHDGHATVITP